MAPGSPGRASLSPSPCAPTPWRDPQPTLNPPPQVLHTNSLLQPARGEELSAALLSIFVDRAADLPVSGCPGTPPSSSSSSSSSLSPPHCPPAPEGLQATRRLRQPGRARRLRQDQGKTWGGGGAGEGKGVMRLGGVSHPLLYPQTCTPSAEPVWDEGFSFLIKRPHVESLELQVSAPSSQRGSCPHGRGPVPVVGVPSRGAEPPVPHR